MTASNADIARYYDTHQVIYTLFWSRTGLHYGLWYDDTKNLTEAISNTDACVMELLDIGASDTVLDAGCGVGGTSAFIAERTGARVQGVTLSDVQLKIARQRATKSSAAALLEFSKQDFTRTSFDDGTFTKVFGIECICHAHRKLDFLKEAYRILKPGGKIAVVDAFLAKKRLNPRERHVYEKFIEGWRVPNLAAKEEFRSALSEAGFRNIAYHDKLENVRKSSRILYVWGLLTFPIGFVKAKLGIGIENFSALYQKELFAGIATYGVFVAEK